MAGGLCGRCRVVVEGLPYYVVSILRQVIEW